MQEVPWIWLESCVLNNIIYIHKTVILPSFRPCTLFGNNNKAPRELQMLLGQFNGTPFDSLINLIFWLFNLFNFRCFWFSMPYLIKGQWVTDQYDRMLGHMTMILFPVLCNVLKTPKMTKSNNQTILCQAQLQLQLQLSWKLR